MDPTVLEDIKEVEKLHRKLMAAGVGYDVYRKYAECMRCGLASWVQQNSAVYTEDVKAAEAYRDNGTWSSRLNRYKWVVMGDQGSGLFFDDGGPRGADYIDFWLMVDDELRKAVEKEAYLVATMCTANHGVGPEDLGGFKGRYAEAELDEVFDEASRNARELVEKLAAKEYDNAIRTSPAVPPSTPVVELGDESVKKLAEATGAALEAATKPDASEPKKGRHSGRSVFDGKKVHRDIKSDSQQQSITVNGSSFKLTRVADWDIADRFLRAVERGLYATKEGVYDIDLISDEYNGLSQGGKDFVNYCFDREKLDRQKQGLKYTGKARIKPGLLRPNV